MATVRSFFSDFIASLAADLIVKPLRETGGEALKIRLQQTLEDKRGELFDELRKMCSEHTEDLKRRHKEALKTGRENRLVALLIKIPKHKEGGICDYTGSSDCDGCRRDALRILNLYTDEEFEQILELLDHNVVAQEAQRLWRETKATAARTGKDLLGKLHEKDSEFAAFLRKKLT